MIGAGQGLLLRAFETMLRSLRERNSAAKKLSGIRIDER